MHIENFQAVAYGREKECFADRFIQRLLQYLSFSNKYYPIQRCSEYYCALPGKYSTISSLYII